MTISEFKRAKNNLLVNYYFELFTGYDECKERSEIEMSQIERDCYSQLSKPMTFAEFALHFKWHYNYLRQNGEITEDECEKYWKALERLSDKSSDFERGSFEHWLNFWFEKAQPTIKEFESEDLESPEFLKSLIEEEKNLIEALQEHKYGNADDLAEKLLKRLEVLGF